MADSQRKTANLFDKDNADIKQCYVWNDRDYVDVSQNTRSVILACKPNTTYTVSKTLSDRFALAYTNTYPTLSDKTYAYGLVVDNDATSLTITTGGSAQYLVIFFIYIPSETKTVEEIVATIMVNEGSTALPYEPYWQHSLRKLTTATEAVENPLYSDGTAITVYTIKGNEEHTGTPSPQNPVMPNGVGVRTENLFDGQMQQGYYAYVTGDYTLADTYVCTHLIPCTENTTYTFRCINTGGGSKNYGYVFFDSAQNRIDSDYINVITEGDVVTHTATTPQNTAFLAINVAYGRRQASVVRPSDITDFMLNTGSTALPYEPYGYKIPILNGQQSIDIYIGDLPLLKSLDGTAVDEISNGTLTRRVDSDGSVLPTPTTTQITMPSIPTTEGANSITVDTTVQPSEFTATWTGWHDASVKEKSENLFDYTTMSSGLTGYYLDSSGNEVSNNTWNITDYIPCDGQAFTLGKIGGNAPAICLYDSNKSYIAGQTYNTGGAATKIDVTVTATQTAKYIRFSYLNSAGGSAADDLSTIMLNEGSTALPYEPYWK